MVCTGHLYIREKQREMNGKKRSTQRPINRIAQTLHLEHWQLIMIFLMIYDVLAVNGAYFLALWLRFDFRFSEIDVQYLSAWKTFTPWYTLICLAVFWFLNLYRSIWRFASFSELTRVAASSAVTAVLHTAAITVFVRRMPISYYVLGAIFQFGFVLAIRFSYRLLNMIRTRRRQAEPGHRVMLIGAGQAGQMILRDMLRSDEVKETVVCIIDDNKNKWGRTVEGITVVGGREDILASAEKYMVDKIYVAIPSASRQELRDILNICKETGCELKTLPGMYQLITGEVSLADMKEVDIADLLGREQIKVDMEEIFAQLKGKTILVTGGGGSIGSELCRQIAGHEPEQLIIFDIYENNAYDIQLELKEKYPNLNLEVRIGSVRDSRKLYQIFGEFRPQIVYHAAAHKHVPLMERNVCEAVRNNVFGTLSVVEICEKYNVGRFIMISTDKAVNPTNVMGATKRVCEMIVQSREGEHTSFSATRFGNVLGSNGSVIPLFRRQIAAGGPITITDKRIIRYFMTIPEACNLVLEAGAMGDGGDIFVFDMGKPVKIYDLARRMIQLSGRHGIEIKEIGLRPGEKLYEELLATKENTIPTYHPKIMHAQVRKYPLDEVDREYDQLWEVLETMDDMMITARQEAGVRVTVITKDPEEIRFGDSENARALIQEMRESGVTVLTTGEEADHYAVIDHRCVWHGGVNLLGKEDAWDNLIRVKNPQIAAELLEIAWKKGSKSEKNL